MILDEAIDELWPFKYDKGKTLTQREVDAIKLGIEALKAWQECRRKGLVPLGWLLPGETEDKEGRNNES